MVATTVSPKKQVGQILVERGLITEDQIQQALTKQSEGEHRKLLGEMVVELGFCTEEQVVEALAEAYDMPYARLEARLVDASMIDSLPHEFVETQLVLPLFKVDGVLTVAIHEPANLFLVEEIAQHHQGPVQLVAATAHNIQATLQQLLPDSSVFMMDDLLGQDDPDAIEVMEQGSLDFDDLNDQSDDSPVIKLANYLILSAIQDGASDIHIEPDDGQLRIRYRVDGRLVEKLTPPVSMHASLVSRIKIMASLDISERRLPQDGAIHIKIKGRPVDLRVSTLPNKFGEKVVMRIIDTSNVLVSLDKLGFAPETLEAFQRQIHQPHGLLLVTGPTGSGKSTTLYSSLAAINSAEVNICTVEDPIEFNLVGVNQFQVHEKIGFTFAHTLRSLLRQDPDVIMIGEIRDNETARIAVQAALTGHMVFSTLHTNDAPSAVTRLHNLGLEPYLISASLEGALAQRLVRRICPECRQAVEPSERVLRLAERLGGPLSTVYAGSGCSRCRNTGFSGRTGLYEMLVPDDELRDAITAGATLNELRQASRRTGMRTLAMDGFDKIARGITTVEEVLLVTAA